jgi:hypothetical protein
VDECQLFVWPMILGGGKPALPAGVRSDLELLEHRFGNGVVHLPPRLDLTTHDGVRRRCPLER